ncbi:MAG: alpha-glucan family phosphorylase [Thermomicrobiales bacterium]
MRAGIALPSHISVPPRLGRLPDLAYNLWWSWNADAQTLFRDLDDIIWEAVGHNAVLFLLRLPQEVLEVAATNPQYLRRYDWVISKFDSMMSASSGETWVGAHRQELVRKKLAYFSAEFGLHPGLPIYSGGLGVLAGDHIKEASDLGLPTVAVSLLYRKGYLNQRLDASCWQQDVSAELQPWEEPTIQVLNSDGSPCYVEISLDNPNLPLRLAIWCVQVGRVSLYLLDSDVEGNPEWTREIASRLYGGDLEHRLRQELMLGIGGVRALRATGNNPDYWHANEGHAALHLLERIREIVAEGCSFQKAAAKVAEHSVFTSHTPVAAGHDVFSPALVDKYFSHYWPQLGLSRDEFLALGSHGASGDGFNLTALSLRLANFRNGVSERHGQVTRSMWHDIWPGISEEQVPITSITNGVHLPTWQSPHTKKLLRRHAGKSWEVAPENPASWEAVREISSAAFWQAHLAAKRDLFDGMRERSRRRFAEGGFAPALVVAAGPFLEEDVLTIGFARRFATYKRAALIFHDPDRLARILNDADKPVQIIFAGKAHPADDGGKLLIQEICWRAQDSRYGGRVAFAEDYDMGLSSLLVAGVDVWLNNPRAPLEASGTSGMKAAANGVPNLSILDGWWREGWSPDNSNGWGIEPSRLEGDTQDAAEAHAIYDLLEQAVVPAYYDRGRDGIPESWVRVCKEAMRTNAPIFSARRMVTDYIDRLYLPAAGFAAKR